MLYIKPHYYDEFSCIADQCPDTCCAGWQIMIDEESLIKYSRVKGGFGNRLMQSIDWEEGAFLRFGGRCSCLNDDNLCDLYEELGADSLCETCRRYPRHMEEYEGVREYSLSLSCPEAARMILTCEETLHFRYEETEEDEPEEYEEFDFLLYTRLCDIRESLFRIIQNRQERIAVRMKKCLQAGSIFQEALEEGRLFEIDGEIRRLTSKKMSAEKEQALNGDTVLSFAEKRNYMDQLCLLETLREEWALFLKGAREILYGRGRKKYRELSEAFILEECKWERYAEQLLMFFVYTYFCGAAYDGNAVSKIMLAVYSTEFIRELAMAKWAENPDLYADREGVSELFIKTAWQYAREVEHSDENLELLERYFENVYCGE